MQGEKRDTPDVRLESVTYNFNTVFKAFDFNPVLGLVACSVSNLVGI